VTLYQNPETYVKQFIERVLQNVKDVEYFEEMRVPHLALHADYGIENIVVEAEPPCHRSGGRKQIMDYMRKFGRKFGILIDVPVERYFYEYPKPCRDKVGFELYMELGDRIVAIYSKEFQITPGKEREVIDSALKEFVSIIELLMRLQLYTLVAKSKPLPDLIVSKVNELIQNYTDIFRSVLSESHGRVKLYFNTWIRTMDLVYGREVVEKVDEETLTDLFIRLTIYVTWLKSLGTTLLESVLGKGKYSIPLMLYIEGSKVATKLFWYGEALTKFNIVYLFERDEYDWVFDPEVSPSLDNFFRELGKFLLSIDWSQEIGLDLLKRVYQNIVPREIRRQLGEFYTPDWIAQLIIWRALHILVYGTPPQEILVPDPIDRAVDLLDEFFKKHQGIPRLIDPTCGSFTFGVHYINTILKWYTSKLPSINSVELAGMIMNSVVGIDLNPVAVIMAKVNYLLQIYRLLAIHEGLLPEQPAIPILRLDLLSLYLTNEVKDVKGTLEPFIFQGETPGRVILKIPLEVLGITFTRELEEQLKKKNIKIVTDKESGGVHYIELTLPLSVIARVRSTVSFLRALMALLSTGIEGFENEINSKLDKNEKEELERFRTTVLALEEKGLDTIWYSIIANYALAIYITKERFDLVLGNLPWVNISKYPRTYAEIVRHIAKNLQCAPPLQAMKKLDISIPLFTVSLNYLTRERSVTGLMVPASIFRGLHGAGWRTYISQKPNAVAEVWDLTEISPFEGTKNQPGIAFVAKSINFQGFNMLKLTGQNISPERFGKEPDIQTIYSFYSENLITALVSKMVQVQFVDGVHWLTDNTYNYAKSVLGKSQYRAHEGATLTSGKGVWIIVGQPKPVQRPIGAPQGENFVVVETELSKNLGMNPFIVEEKFVFRGIKGEDIKHGKIKSYRYFLAPYDRNGRPLKTLQLQKTFLWKNYLSNPRIMSILLGTSTHIKQTAWSIERLNKNAVSNYKVVWRDAAEEFIPAIDTSGAIPDYTVNYVVVENLEEAFYLMAVLLSPKINSVVRELSPWIGHVQPRFINYFKIPRYNPQDPNHQKLVEIGKAIYTTGTISEEMLREIDNSVTNLEPA